MLRKMKAAFGRQLKALARVSPKRMMRAGTALARNEEGAAAVEYGLICALVAVVCIASLQLVGNNLSSVFAKIATSIPIGPGP